ncbi:uncharacterized protein LY89DRAFT_789277 [Mollisia scopiformis]|uniref:Uncharacterized protein n=1 Tax=Mollisia scopiformis TaxID=149040 RepID=A0A132B6I7_MOLSC|nr:uncharacterized protein LY89DRAFT_789277 [Mollisia scopiformis]KUJ08022.1 hypothetical protein LY89DRAFT_789277 [Mollisia scopiformis]
MPEKSSVIRRSVNGMKYKIKESWAKRPWGPKRLWIPLTDDEKFPPPWQNNKASLEKIRSPDEHICTLAGFYRRRGGGLMGPEDFVVVYRQSHQGNFFKKPQPIDFNATKVELIAYGGMFPMVAPEYDDWVDIELTNDTWLSPNQRLQVDRMEKQVAEASQNEGDMYAVLQLLRRFKRLRELDIIIEVRITEHNQVYSSQDLARLKALLRPHPDRDEIQGRVFIRFERTEDLPNFTPELLRKWQESWYGALTAPRPHELGWPGLKREPRWPISRSYP